MSLDYEVLVCYNQENKRRYIRIIAGNNYDGSVITSLLKVRVIR